MTPEQEARLPSYARNELRNLRRQVASAEAAEQKARLTTDPDQTDTLIDDFGRGPIGLPAGERVVFRVDGDDVRGRITVRRVPPQFGPSYIEIMGGRPVVVSPSASNVIRVYFEPGR
jgi:hypothetical protein